MRKLLLIYLRPYWRFIVPGVVLVLMQAIAALSLPTLNADIINNGVAKSDTAYILRIGGYMLLVAGLQTCVRSGSGYLPGRGRRWAWAVTCEGPVPQGGELLAGRTQPVRYPLAHHPQHQRRPADTDGDQSRTHPADLCADDGRWGLIMAMRQSLGLSWVLGVVVPVIGVLLWLLLRTAIPLFRSMQKKIDRINLIMRESLTRRAGDKGVRPREVRGAALRRGQPGPLVGVSLKVLRLFTVVFPTLFLIMNLATVGIMWFGAQRIDTGDMQVGSLFAFIMYVMHVLMSVMFATMMASFIPRASASGARIQEVPGHGAFYRRPGAADGAGGSRLDKARTRRVQGR